MKKRKNIDLSDETVRILTVRAAQCGTNFKNYVEAKLEKFAKEILKQNNGMVQKSEH
jgi:hypothetical protein